MFIPWHIQPGLQVSGMVFQEMPRGRDADNGSSKSFRAQGNRKMEKMQAVAGVEPFQVSGHNSTLYHQNTV